MGSEKRRMEEGDLWWPAYDILVEYGFVDKCEMHDEYTDLLAGEIDEDAEQLSQMIADMRKKGFSGSDEEAQEALSEALRLAGEECASCGKNSDS